MQEAVTIYRTLAEANPDKTNAVGAVNGLADEREARLDPSNRTLLQGWPALQAAYAGTEYVVTVRDRDTWGQERISIDQLEAHLRGRLA